MDTAMGRIEMQITEIRDLITSGGGGSGGTTIQAIREVSAISIQTGGSQPDSVASAISNQPAAGSYEAMKAGLLESTESQTTTPEPAAQITQSTDADSQTVSEETTQQEENVLETVAEVVEKAYVEEDIQAVKPPESVDFESANPEQLQEAIESRDTYLEYLIRKLRAAELSPKFLRGWQELEGVEEAVKERLEQLEETLNDNLVRAEIELSLERARLGRESIRIEQLELQIEKKMKRMGLTTEDVGDSSQSNDEPELDSTKGRSWLKMLGMAKDEE